MTKLARYLKRYLLLLIIGVALLFGQAMLELNLPNMMSNIVNVGIQKGGIEEVAPKAVSPGVMSALQMFVPDDKVYVTNRAYTAYDDLTLDAQAGVDKTFPDAWQKKPFVLTADAQHRQEIDDVMARAGYALMDAMQKMMAASGVDTAALTETGASFDFSFLQGAGLGVLGQLPSDVRASSIAAAAAVDEMLVDAVAGVINKAAYAELGADTDAIQTDYILRVGVIMVLLSVATVVCAIGAGFCFARLGAGTARDLRRDVFGKVCGFSSAEMDRFSTASLITRTTNDVTQVQMMYTMALRFLVFAPIMGIGGVIMAVSKSPGMSWIIGAAVAIILVVIVILLRAVMPRFKKMQSLIDRLNLVARENLTGIMVVRAFSNQKFQQERFEKANRELTANSLSVGRAMVLLMPVIMLIMNSTALFILYQGAVQTSAGTIQVGDIMAFIQYAMQVIMSFLFIAMIFVMVPRASVSAERIDEVLRSETTIHDPKTPKTLGGRAKGVLAFNHVSFRYDGAEEDVLHDVNFVARPGQTTAFIGATGSGKTTLVNLIPRFYDVSAGSVTLDGVDVRELAQTELRDNIGYVPQKALLFSGSVASNLRYGDETVNDDALREAAGVAQATEFIDQMEEGFESSIAQGGTNVSGGQRQRLSIARALVKKAPVIIFDDSFSALDFATDAKLRARLKPTTQDATVLIVAQRISTIMNAEQIVVLDGGAVVGLGTHRELLQNCPAYREIAKSQLSEEELA